MMRILQRLTPFQRRLVFFAVFGGALLLLVAVTLLLISSALNSVRTQPVALVEAVTVTRFAALPGDDAYPAAVAVAPDGTVYTGSYASGAVWAIDAAGEPRELPGTRDALGAVSGLTVAPDGTLLVVDQRDTDPRTTGGDVKRVSPGGEISRFADLPDGFITPDDIELDSQGRVYVTDRGRNEVWRFDADGGRASAWWSPPADGDAARGAVTGLAYDPARDALVITDPDLNVIYRVAVAGGVGEVLYRHIDDGTLPPGFDGATVAPDGTLYVAALGENNVVRLDGDNLVYIAGGFRGASDVAFAPPDRLYVANWDQSSLVNPLARAQLPFTLDAIILNGGE